MGIINEFVDMMPEEEGQLFRKWANQWIKKSVRFTAPEGINHRWMELMLKLVVISNGKIWGEDIKNHWNEKYGKKLNKKIKSNT